MTMSKMIDDFSARFEMVNPDNNYHYIDFVELKIEEWGQYAEKVAYTFNSDSENTAKQLVKALEKYRCLRFVTGVTGRTKNWLIQVRIKDFMEKLLGDRLAWIYSSGGDTVYYIDEMKPDPKKDWPKDMVCSWH